MKMNWNNSSWQELDDRGQFMRDVQAERDQEMADCFLRQCEEIDNQEA
jgi:hypothetical protein